MSYNFKATAIEATTLSPIMEHRTKVKVDEIIFSYPDGITITEFDILNGNDKLGQPTTYPVIAFAENPGLCFFGGAILKKIILAWVDAFDGDVTGASEALKAEGGVKVKMERTTTKSGNALVNVIVL